MTYDQLHDGQWTRPIMRGYRLKCCDCGLVHKIDFRVRHQGKRHHVEFRPRRVKK